MVCFVLAFWNGSDLELGVVLGQARRTPESRCLFASSYMQSILGIQKVTVIYWGVILQVFLLPICTI